MSDPDAVEIIEQSASGPERPRPVPSQAPPRGRSDVALLAVWAVIGFGGIAGTVWALVVVI